MLEKVLLLDKDIKARDFLYEVLSDVGFRVITVPNGSEALERLKKERPSLVIIDDTDGEFNGIDLSKRIRSFDKEMRIIMLGSKSKESIDKDELDNAGISAYLPRNFHDPEIIKSIISVVKSESGIKVRSGKMLGKVLIVDDEYESREMVSNYLNRNGFETDSASSGEECIEKLKAKSFDAIVLDITMEGMDGILTLKRIKEVSPSVSVVMATALGSKDIKSEAEAMGASDYIVKPFNLAQLESSLLALIISKKKSP